MVLLLIIILVNLMPAFAPPTWTILVVFLVKYDLNIYATIACGVCGATIGRFILSHYIGWFSHQVFNEKQHKNLSYLGNKFGDTHTKNFYFTFIYSLTPLSTTVLFVAAGMAKIKATFVLLGFFCGRIVSYSVLAFSTKALAHNFSDITNGIFSWKSTISSLGGIAVIFLFIFTDWITLFEKKKFKLMFRVWKWNK